MYYGDDLRWTLFPDLHGQYDVFMRAVEHHYDHTDMFGILGDFIDGPEARKVINAIRELGAKAIVGNHEWVARNAMSIENPTLAAVWADDVWPKYEKDMLKNYGLLQGSAMLGWVTKAQLLRKELEVDGTLEWLNELPPFIETPKFIAVHSGPQLYTPWELQSAELLELSARPNRIYSVPEQIFSGQLAGPITPSDAVDSRIFVTGHRHMDLSLEQRRQTDRVCLASVLSKGAPLYTWTSEDDVIHEHAA